MLFLVVRRPGSRWIKTLASLSLVGVVGASLVGTQFANAATQANNGVTTSGGTVIGSTLTVTSSFTNTKGAGRYVLDTEVYNTSNQKVKQFYTFANLSPGQSVRETYTWNTAGMKAGTYALKQGVFYNNWTSIVAWRSNSGSLTLTNASGSGGSGGGSGTTTTTAAPKPKPTTTTTSAPKPTTTTTAAKPVSGNPQKPTAACASAWQTVTVNGEQWVRTSNNWGGANVCLNTWDGKTASYLVQSQTKSPSGGVMAYPDLSQGCGNNGGYCTTGWTSKQVSSLSNPQVSWTTSQSGAVAGSKYDTAADLWFSSTANFQSNGAEILVSINNQGEPPNTSKQVSVGGVNYYFYVVPQHGWNEIIFARVQPVSSVTNLGLKPFMDYAISQGLFPSSYYFVNASFGNEIWAGGTGLQTTSLSLQQ